MPDTARVASLPDSYVHALFQRFQETHFEQMLLVAFARNLDLAQVILNNELPKGLRIFSENDVREFIERFNPTTTLLEHTLLTQGFTGTSKAAFPRRL